MDSKKREMKAIIQASSIQTSRKQEEGDKDSHTSIQTGDSKKREMKIVYKPPAYRPVDSKKREMKIAIQV